MCLILKMKKRQGCMHLTMKSMLPFFPDSLSEYLSY